MFLNTELFGHQRGASNKGYKKIKYGTMVLSTQNLHLGNANVNQRFEHGIVSPAYKTYDISGCSVNFIAQWIKSEAAKRFFYNATTVGASVCRRNVEWDTLYEQLLYLPCLDEQEKLADFLSLISSRINKQQQLVTALKKYKRGLLLYYFSAKHIEHLGNTEYYVFSDLARRRTEKYDPRSGGDAICIELEHLEQETGRIIGSTPAVNQCSIKNICKKGDVLFGKLRPYLRKYAFVKQDCVCSSEIWVLVPSEKILPQYLFYLVQSNDFIRIANVSSGTKMPRAEWSNVERGIFSIPSEDTQQAVVSQFEGIDTLIANSNAIYEQLQKQKSALLQQLFI